MRRRILTPGCQTIIQSASNRVYRHSPSARTLEHSNTQTLTSLCAGAYLHPLRRRILTPTHPIGLKPSLPSLPIRQNTRTLEHSNTHLPLRRRILTPTAPAHTYTDTFKRPQSASNRVYRHSPSVRTLKHSNTQTLIFSLSLSLFRKERERE